MRNTIVIYSLFLITFISISDQMFEAYFDRQKTVYDQEWFCLTASINKVINMTHKFCNRQLLFISKTLIKASFLLIWRLIRTSKIVIHNLASPIITVFFCVLTGIFDRKETPANDLYKIQGQSISFFKYIKMRFRKLTWRSD